MAVIQNSCAWMRTIRSSFQNSLWEVHAAVLTLPPPQQVTRGASHTGTPPPRRPGPANPRLTCRAMTTKVPSAAGHPPASRPSSRQAAVKFLFIS